MTTEIDTSVYCRACGRIVERPDGGRCDGPCERELCGSCGDFRNHRESGERWCIECHEEADAKAFAAAPIPRVHTTPARAAAEIVDRIDAGTTANT